MLRRFVVPFVAFVLPFLLFALYRLLRDRKIGQNWPLTVLFVIGAVLAAQSFALAALTEPHRLARAAEAPAAPPEKDGPTLILGGVCIDTPDASYALSSQMPVDFYLVDMTRRGTQVLRAYIGNLPQVDANKVVLARKSESQCTRLDEHSVLCAPPSDQQPFIHVMFANVSRGEQTQLLRGIFYCDREAK